MSTNSNPNEADDSSSEDDLSLLWKKRRRSMAKKHLSLEERIGVLKCLDNGMQINSVAEKFRIDRKSVRTIKKNREVYMEKQRKGITVVGNQTMRVRGGSIVDRNVHNWFMENVNRGISVTGPQLQAKARLVYKSLGYEDNAFVASNGWLQSFNKRWGIRARTICGESLGVDLKVVDDWKASINNKLSSFHSRDIYNTDETALFWRGLPSRSLLPKGSDSHGFKVSKDRITILFTVSMSGERRKPLVINNALKPRAFRHGPPSDVDWYANANAWMTRQIFSQYLKDFDDSMRRQNRCV